VLRSLGYDLGDIEQIPGTERPDLDAEVIRRRANAPVEAQVWEWRDPYWLAPRSIPALGCVTPMSRRLLFGHLYPEIIGDMYWTIPSPRVDELIYHALITRDGEDEDWPSRVEAAPKAFEAAAAESKRSAEERIWRTREPRDGSPEPEPETHHDYGAEQRHLEWGASPYGQSVLAIAELAAAAYRIRHHDVHDVVPYFEARLRGIQASVGLSSEDLNQIVAIWRQMGVELSDGTAAADWAQNLTAQILAEYEQARR
jgi:hypothetical protein